MIQDQSKMIIQGKEEEKPLRRVLTDTEVEFYYHSLKNP